MKKYSFKSAPIAILAPFMNHVVKNYLVNTRYKNINKRTFRILGDPVLVRPNEIFDYFIDVKDDLTMEANLYIELPERATV